MLCYGHEPFWWVNSLILKIPLRNFRFERNVPASELNKNRVKRKFLMRPIRRLMTRWKLIMCSNEEISKKQHNLFRFLHPNLMSYSRSISKSSETLENVRSRCKWTSCIGAKEYCVRYHHPLGNLEREPTPALALPSIPTAGWLHEERDSALSQRFRLPKEEVVCYLTCAVLRPNRAIPLWLSIVDHEHQNVNAALLCSRVEKGPVNRFFGPISQLEIGS